MFEFLEDTPYQDSCIVSMGLYLPTYEEQAAVEISQAICKNEVCSFVLGARNPPRVRLYESVFPTNEVAKIQARLTKLAKDMIPFQVLWGMSEADDHFLAVWVKLNEPLRLFHEAVLDEISPLRHGYFKQKYTTGRPLLSEEEKQSLEKWGSPWAEPYNPHMILVKAKDKFTGDLPEVDWGFRESVLLGVLMEVKTNQKKIVSAVKLPFARHAKTT